MKAGVRIAAAVLLATFATQDTSSAEEPLNVLLIAADDHAAYVTGVYGNTKVRTPNIDRLAAQGVRFDRAYCNSPVCTASRQSFLTGRYPRTTGVTQLRTALPESEITLAEVLSGAGYATATYGKMHFNSVLSHGFDEIIDRPQHRAYLQSLPERAVIEQEVLPPWRPFRDPANIWLNADYLPYGATIPEMESTFFADNAERFLREDREQPFFLMVSFYEPHSPFHFPVEYAGRHDPDTFDVPDVQPQDAWQIPEIFESLSHEEKQGIRAAYYTSVEFLDMNVGRVLDALDQSPHRENTLVIYLGDHGYMLGQHGRIEKHCSYEPAIRAPLIVAGPGIEGAGRGTDALVEFVDIAPTILDACGIDIPATMQGKSLQGILDGTSDAHRPHVVVEYSENEEACIRADRWKLVYITGNRDRDDGYITAKPIPKRNIMLFDLENDPEELNNLANLPEQRERVEGLLDTLIEHLIQTARKPEAIPNTDDPHELLAHLLQPDDIQPGVN